jgi:hypothetical protein
MLLQFKIKAIETGINLSIVDVNRNLRQKPFGIPFPTSSFHLQMTSSEGFQHHFSIISKFDCCDCLHENECSVYSYLFCCTKMR